MEILTYPNLIEGERRRKGERKMDINKMTKDEKKERLLTLERHIAEYAQVEREHSRRLAYLRSFERFANTIDQTLNQLRNDIGELNRMFSVDEGDTDGGE